jgi:hypothetical protein
MKSVRAAALLVTLLAVSSSTSCSTPIACTANLVNGLVVTVTNASGTQICDAVVTAQDDSYSTRLIAGERPPCPYSGAPERPGTYNITVDHGAFRKTVSNIQVTGGRCHVTPQFVTVSIG